ncbi:MAG: hypothetical protein K2R98_25110 [Gemmataceae bacterium]|nr:hypothetical protein [Gemmataceae bacterium]
MKPAKVRLLVTVGLFVLWIGFLAYLAFATRNPVVLSRPQFLASAVDVIAEVDSQDASAVKVQEVHWPATLRDKLVGQTIRVGNLKDTVGWNGPDRYILALDIRPGGEFRVTPTPRSPGFDPGSKTYRPHIYPDTPEARRQLDEIPKPSTHQP